MKNKKLMLKVKIKAKQPTPRPLFGIKGTDIRKPKKYPDISKLK